MCKVLIADNELALAFKLEKYLTGCGYQVVGPAVSGRQAISMTENLKPDLALINTKLAGEMDGLDAAEHIKRALEVPVVIVSWYQDKRRLHRAVKINSEGYVVKPFHFAQVHASIEVPLKRPIAPWKARPPKQILLFPTPLPQRSFIIQNPF